MMNDMADKISNGMQGVGMPVSAHKVSFLERFKHYLNPKNFMEMISTSRDKITEMGIYLGVGFLVGFLLKKYNKYIIIFLLCIIGLVILQQFEIVTIFFNTAKIEEVFGIKMSTLDADLFSVYWHWIKLNFAIVLSFSIGFLLGIKVG